MSGWRREGCRITASPDLNTLFPASASLFATMANKINEPDKSRAWQSVLSGRCHSPDVTAGRSQRLLEPSDETDGAMAAGGRIWRRRATARA